LLRRVPVGGGWAQRIHRDPVHADFEMQIVALLGVATLALIQVSSVRITGDA
jgi:hypothetical protein